MKKRLFLVLSVLLTTLSIQAADGDTFTANTVEGVEMTFKVISEEAKTCLVGEGSSASIPTSTSGAVTIPATANGYSVKTITHKAFYNCSSLTSITIPKGVTSIGDNAFYGCSDLTIITSKILEPFAVNCFQYTTTNATLYVPKGTVEKYKATDGWKEFKTIKEIKEYDEHYDVNRDGKIDVTDVTLLIDWILIH